MTSTFQRIFCTHKNYVKESDTIKAIDLGLCNYFTSKNSVDQWLTQHPNDQAVEYFLIPVAHDQIGSPILGNILPKIGSTVQIHLSSINEWVEVVVTGYYVLPSIGNGLRVNVTVIHSSGVENARDLSNIKVLDDNGNYSLIECKVTNHWTDNWIVYATTDFVDEWSNQRVPANSYVAYDYDYTILKICASHDEARDFLVQTCAIREYVNEQNGVK